MRSEISFLSSLILTSTDGVPRAMGMRPIVVDTGDKKESLANRIGAQAFIDFKKVGDVPAKVRDVADGVGAHGVLVSNQLDGAFLKSCADFDPTN